MRDERARETGDTAEQHPANRPEGAGPRINTDGRPVYKDGDADQIHFSPVCTWCVHWEPEDGHHCAGAYPRGGQPIPNAIWIGRVLHLQPYAGDHGVTFDLTPEANKDAFKASNPGLYAGYLAREGKLSPSTGAPDGE